MPWISDVKAVLQTWYLGSEAGNAIADIISGDENPSGKLPFSFPVKLTDNSAHFFGELS
jgi:beta-glucosidase